MWGFALTLRRSTVTITDAVPPQNHRSALTLRSVHLTDEPWLCQCHRPHEPYNFESKLTSSFAELLDEDAPDLCDAYAGSDRPSAGDGILGIPMLIHRGPGNPTGARESRYVLFLTLRPVYGNMRREGIDMAHHRYNPTLQIHVGCILYNQVSGGTIL